MKRKPNKIVVSRAAWEKLEAAVNALTSDQGGKIFCTGGALEYVELETNYDWALYHAAHILVERV